MTKAKYASILTIGDELLIGQVIDTNSAWMAQELNKIGIWVKRRVAVGDVWEEIWSALEEESKHADIILITGGLGPTADDITKPLLCEYFGGKMIWNEAVLEHVKTIFSKYLNRPLLESNLKQAMVPDVCTVLQNQRGTAPGMWFEKEEKIFISMPGVPIEMKGIMTDYVLPKLPSIFSLPSVVHRTLLTAGIGESFLAERIKDFENALPPHIKLAYLPNFGLVRLRLTALGEDKIQLTKEIDEIFIQLQTKLADVLVINEDKTLQDAIGLMLKTKKLTLCTAESCTGGYVSHLITGIPGSSSYFMGSVVSYDNSIKSELLGVTNEILEQHGAVSEEAVLKMAAEAKKLLHTNYSVAISGIMGPDGGTKLKPVGTVWIAVSGMKETKARKFLLRFDRTKNIEVAGIHALTFLWQTIQSDQEYSSV